VTTVSATPGLPEIAAGLLFVALNAYVLTGGADLGSGVWDLVATGPRREQQRELLAEAIGPIWEANSFWLVIVVVVCYRLPPAFAMLASPYCTCRSLDAHRHRAARCCARFRSYGARAGREHWERPSPSRAS
jgi:cytochrome d ubiquinol oxidase subunit II